MVKIINVKISIVTNKIVIFSRQVLMCQIIRKMQQDLNPPTMPSKPSHR